MASDDHVVIGLAAQAEPVAATESSDEDVAVALPPGPAGAPPAARPGRQAAPKTGRFGGWLIGDLDAADGSGQRQVVGVAEMRWSLETPPGDWEAGNPVYVDPVRAPAKAPPTWAHLRYEVIQSWCSPHPVPLALDVKLEGLAGAQAIRRACDYSGVQFGGLTLQGALANLRYGFLAVVLLPLTIATTVSGAALPRVVRVLRLRARILSRFVVEGHPTLTSLRRLHQRCTANQRPVTMGPITRAEWEQQCNDILLELPPYKTLEGGTHKGVLTREAGVRDIDPLRVASGLQFTQYLRSPNCFQSDGRWIPV